MLESELLWGIAARALTLGVNVILDYGCWSREERELFRKSAQDLGAKAELIVLEPPIDVLWARLDARNQAAPADTFQITRAELTSYDKLFQRPEPDELAGYDEVRSL